MQFFEESFIEDDDSFIAESADVTDPPGDSSRDSAASSVGVSGTCLRIECLILSVH